MPRKKSLIIKKTTIDSSNRYQYLLEKQLEPIFSNHIAEIFKNSPSMVSWKDADLAFLGCSPKLAHLANLNKTSAIIGKKDSDLPWGREGYSEVFIEEDKEVLKGNQLTILGKYQFYDKERLMLVKKLPIFNQSDNIVGIFNYLTEFHSPILSNVIIMLNEFDIETPPYLINIIKSLFFDNDVCSLSVREEECAKYLLKGLTSKEIGKILGISNRTVELHLMSLKEKLNCNKTTTLIVKLIKLGYLDDISE